MSGRVWGRHRLEAKDHDAGLRWVSELQKDWSPARRLRGIGLGGTVRVPSMPLLGHSFETGVSKTWG